MSNDWLPTLDSLKGAMKGQSVTSKWDVVVSYDITYLNERLAEAWKRVEKNQETFSAPGKFVYEGIRYGYEKVAIDRPTLQFDSSGDKTMAELHMGLEGQIKRTQIQDGQEKDMEPLKIYHGTYILHVKVPIVSELKVVTTHGDALQKASAPAAINSTSEC